MCACINLYRLYTYAISTHKYISIVGSNCKCCGNNIDGRLHSGKMNMRCVHMHACRSTG